MADSEDPPMYYSPEQMQDFKEKSTAAVKELFTVFMDERYLCFKTLRVLKSCRYASGTRLGS